MSGPALLVDAGSADAALGLRTSGPASGPGDVSLYGTYSLESLYDRGWFIDFTGRVKAPTASFAKGLGTGEWDGAFQVGRGQDLRQVHAVRRPSATNFTGSPPGFALRNVVFGTVGVQYTWTEKIATGVIYDVRQSTIASAKAPQEGTAYVNVKVAERWSAECLRRRGLLAQQSVRRRRPLPHLPLALSGAALFSSSRLAGARSPAGQAVSADPRAPSTAGGPADPAAARGPAGLTSGRNGRGPQPCRAPAG